MQAPVYVPIIKNRASEFNALDTLMANKKLDTRITPFVKVLLHQDTADKRRYYQTLEGINAKFEGHKAFIDYYRCDLGEYKRVDFAKIGNLRAFSENPDLYLDRMATIAKYPNLIPVVTIARNVVNPLPAEIRKTIDIIRNASPDAQVGLCFEGTVRDYEDLIVNNLTKTDFVFFDTGEQPPIAKTLEIRRLMNLEPKAHPILLNSPRGRGIKNREYPPHGLTSIIDNSTRDQFAKLGFGGFGDYAGLRNDLPLNIKTGGKGNALALLYDFGENKFWSYMNEQSDDGPSGFRNLVPRIIDDMRVLNPNEDCLTCNAIKKRADKGNFGTYSTWITYTVMRYIQQMSDHLKLLPGL